MKVSKELLKGSTSTLILSLLNERPMYGYEMIKELEAKSEGIFSFKEGTIYPILHNLEAERIHYLLLGRREWQPEKKVLQNQ